MIIFTSETKNMRVLTANNKNDYDAPVSRHLWKIYTISIKNILFILPVRLSARQSAADGGAGDAGHHGAQRAAVRLLEGGVVAGLVAARHGRVHDVQPRVEQRPAARPRHHRQLVDGGVGVTLRLKAGLGDAATSDNK